MIAPGAVSLHTLRMKRPTGSPNLDQADMLRATLAVIDLARLEETARDDLVARYFHAAEHQRRQAFDFARRRDSFTAGRLAAKLALAAHCPDVDMRQVAIGKGVFDQPLITGGTPACGTLAVSISHSTAFAVALVFHRGHPMGIDVDLPSDEDIAPVLGELPNGTAAQLSPLALNARDSASLIWVSRESLGKALTTGMMSPLSLYAPSSIVRTGAHYVLHYENFAQYRTLVWPGDGGWLAITLPARTEFDAAAISWS